MGFNCGVIGLPNVGKSTLFNALTRTQAAEAANYPFCTIEPNTGRVAVPDPRLRTLAELAGSRAILPAWIEFVDIAGLVRGAAQGEGLGNRFLASIREVDALCHVLRCFPDPGVIHVEGDVDPVRDAAIVETELMLADLESLERRLAGMGRKLRGADPDARADAALMERALALLSDGQPARTLDVDPEEARRLRHMQLLTAKPVLYVCNVAEEAAANGGDERSRQVAALAATQNAAVVVISAAIEAEVAQLEQEEERRAFLSGLGLPEAGLDRLIRAGYTALDRITFFTVGPKETRAWTIPNGATAPQAAGAIHTDFERGFICADVIAYADFAVGGEQHARDNGKSRLEGRGYKVQDGAVIHFRFNV